MARFPAFAFFLVVCAAFPARGGEIVINELDTDQAGNDSGEFVELFDGGAGNTSLEGLVLVFFNGTSGEAYFVADLAERETDGAGYFVAGNGAVSPTPDLLISDDTLQNGPDAIALYRAPAQDFYVGMSVTVDSLVTAVVYAHGDATPAFLQPLLASGEAVNENGAGNAPLVSLQRCPNGEGDFVLSAPTPGTANTCLQAADSVVINEVDSDQAGLDSHEFVELYDGGIGGLPLDGLILVFYNGATDTSYWSASLNGFVTDAQGFFVVGNASEIPEIAVASGLLQNGADAVALFRADGRTFPEGTPLTTAGLLDVLVYGTDDDDDTELLGLLADPESMADEDATGDAEVVSLQRCPDGQGLPLSVRSFFLAEPTPRALNDCPADLPVAEFEFQDSPIYVGAAVSFADASSGVVTSWQWSFEDGVPATSDVQSPAGIAFTSPGEKAVRLVASNGTGVDSVTRVLRVYHREPSVESVFVSDLTPAPCDSVGMAPVNALGEGPLTFVWTVFGPDNVRVFEAEGSTGIWVLPAWIPPAQYRARVVVSNALGGVFAESATIHVADVRPTVELFSDAANPTALRELTIGVNLQSIDVVSGITIDDFEVANATLLSYEFSGSIYEARISFEADGPASVRLPDGAGTILCGVPTLASNVLQFEYDGSAPTVAISTTARSATVDAILVDIVFSEPVIDFSESGVLVENAIVGGLTGSGTTYQVSILPSALGLAGVAVAPGAAHDAAGNLSTESNVLIHRFVANAFTHGGDSNADGRLDLSELLRVAQLYSVAAYHCETGTEDGYGPGAGSVGCIPHSSDYNPQDWRISLSELLRAVQIFVHGAYHECAMDTSEDGYCLGVE